MAASFTILGSYRTSQLVGGSSVQPVQAFQVTTKPHDIYFEFRRPIGQLQRLTQEERDAEIAGVAEQLAKRLEAVRVEPHVTDVSYSQTTTPSGQLADTITVYVESTSGESDGTVAVPLANVGPGEYTTSRIHAEVRALDAAEAL